ncbi:hypothetical protein D9619_003734 [Psilocybe cf. subviscida]|uniref:Uncharacterized protein n=1 Tax=Psilocybe cf. subviscida TaxID=2480587 RepID=A0A8H5EU51_9AGAR|nr:hypothetical protein D9619_003734 [Psilocybe cf. subviscida]
MFSHAAPDPIIFKSGEHERVYHICIAILERGTEDDSIEYHRYWNSQDEVGKAVIMECVLKQLNTSLYSDTSWWQDYMRENFAYGVVESAITNMKVPRIKTRPQPVVHRGRRARTSPSTNRTTPPKQPIPSPLLEKALFKSVLRKRQAAGLF